MDFSDLGATKIGSKKKLDFSDLGAVQIPSAAAPDTGLDKLANLDKEYILSPLSKVAQFVGKHSSVPGQETSPQSLLQTVPGLLSSAAGKVGQTAAEQMGAQGQNPYLAASVGTAISMAPDIAMSGVNPAEGVSGITRIAKASDAAIPAAERAIGFTKMFKKTPAARKMNKMAAQVALEEGVIPNTGSPDKMLDNAIKVQDRAVADMNDVFQRAYVYKQAKNASIPGQISDSKALAVSGDTFNPNAMTVPGGQVDSPIVLDQEARIVDPKDIIRSLQRLRPKQAAMGSYKADHAVIDNAIDTVRANGNAPLTLQEANAIKTKIQASIPYGQEGHDMAKSAASSIRESVDSSLDQVADELGDKTIKQQFLDAKRRYGASQRMQEGINDRIAKKGNNMMNLSSLMMGAGEFAVSHNPLKAAAIALATKGASVAGPSITANLINQAAHSGTMALPAMNTLGLVGRKKTNSGSLGLLKRATE